MAPTAELSLTQNPMGNSHKNLLVRNHWANCNQTFVEWSLDGPRPKLCPVIPTSNKMAAKLKIEKVGMKLKKNLLLWNYWANLNETLLKWFLDGPLPNLCPVIPTSNQDGRQAQNRKKGGDEILIVHCCFSVNQNELKFNCSYMARSSLTYIPGFSVKFFFQPIYTDYAN